MAWGHLADGRSHLAGNGATALIACYEAVSSRAFFAVRSSLPGHLRRFRRDQLFEQSLHRGHSQHRGIWSSRSFIFWGLFLARRVCLS